jgi:hypothetical protein
MQIKFSTTDALHLSQLIDDLVYARVDHTIANQQNLYFPSSEDGIWAAQNALLVFLQGDD